MRRDVAVIGMFRLGVTLASVAVIGLLMDPFPVQGAEEAEFIDTAFIAMTYIAAPVFGLVIAVVAHSVLVHRSSGPQDGDGELITGSGPTAWVPRVWLGATTVLAVVVMIYPGLTGLAELRSDKTSELEVTMTAFQFGWLAEYAGRGVRVSGQNELVLPAETRIRFDVTALDVLHGFWIPAFRTKIDAVPGQTTTLYITTTDPGPDERDTDHAYRVQCAELCGLLHARMTMPVRVVEAAEFEAWIAEQTAARLSKQAAEPITGRVAGKAQ